MTTPTDPDRELIVSFLDAAGFDYSINDEEGVMGFDLVIRVYGRLVSKPDPYEVVVRCSGPGTLCGVHGMKHRGEDGDE